MCTNFYAYRTRMQSVQIFKAVLQKLFELNHVTCVYEEIFRLLNVNAFNKYDVSFYLHKKYQINNSIEKKPCIPLIHHK